MGKRLGVIQSNYIPWKGYFDFIAAVDEFVIYDDVQFTKNDWRNRNQIKTPNGMSWLSIPVGNQNGKAIDEVPLPGRSWAKKHWRTLEMNYRKARYFDEVAHWLAPHFDINHELLSDLNQSLINAVCAYLEIDTPITNVRDYEPVGNPSTRLIDLCQKTGATTYLSGPAAMSYLDVAAFNEAGIDVEWMDYSGYPEYRQLWGGFVHAVSILDVLFNCGPYSKHKLKYADPEIWSDIDFDILVPQVPKSTIEVVA